MDFEHYLPIVAAPVGGHGRADWGNWANRQLRDQNGDDAGEWIEMGRGSRFRYRKADGSIGTGTATYVGFSDKPNQGRFYVKGVDGIKDGVYDLDAGSVDPVKFYFAEGTKVGDYLENYYKSIGRNLDDIDAPSKLPVIDFSALTPSELTKEEANEIKTENRMPPPRNLNEELKSRTESAKTASELKEGDIVFDEALKRYGSVELVEPSPDGSGNVDAVVRWSNNQVQELTNLPADQQIKVWPQEQEQQEAAPASTITQEEQALPFETTSINEEYEKTRQEDLKNAEILVAGEAAGPEITPNVDDVRSGFLSRYFDDNAELVDFVEGNDIKHLMMATVLEKSAKGEITNDEEVLRDWYEKVFESLAAEDPEFKKNYPTWESRSELLYQLTIDDKFLVTGGKVAEEGQSARNWDERFTKEQREMQKRINRRFAELILKLNPDGKIKIYRNAIAQFYSYDNIEHAAAGYWSFDRDFAYSFNTNSTNKLTPFEGRLSAEISVDDVIGIIGASQGGLPTGGITPDEMPLSISPDEANAGVLKNLQFNGIQRDLVKPDGPGRVKRVVSDTGGNTWFRYYGVYVHSVNFQSLPVQASVIDEIENFQPELTGSLNRITREDFIVNPDSTVVLKPSSFTHKLKFISEFQKATGHVLLVNNYNRSREAVDLESQTLFSPVDQNIVTLSPEQFNLYTNIPEVVIPENVELTKKEQEEFNDLQKKIDEKFDVNSKYSALKPAPARSVGAFADSDAQLVDFHRSRQQEIVDEATKRKINADKEIEDKAAEYRRQQIEDAKSALENAKKFIEQLKSEGDLENASYMEQDLVNYESRVTELEAGYDRYENPGHSPISERIQTLLNIIETYDADGSIRDLILNGGTQEEVLEAIKNSSAYKKIEEAQRQYEAELEEYLKTAEPVEDDGWNTPVDPNRPEGPDVTNEYIDENVSIAYVQDNRLTPEENAAQRKEAIESFKPSAQEGADLDDALVDSRKKKKAEKESVTKDPSELQEGDKVLVDGEEKTVVKTDEALKVWGTNEDGEEISVVYAYDQDLADALEANEDGTLQLEDEDNGLITVEVHSPITRVFVEEDEEPLEYTSGETAEMAPTEAVAAEPDDSQAVEPTKAEYDSAIENGRPTFIFNLKLGDVIVSSTGGEFLFVSSKRLESKDGLVPFEITVQDSNGELKTFNTKGDKVVAKHEPLQTKNPKYKEFDIRQLKVVNKKSELKAQPTEPAKQEEAADEKQAEVVSQKEVGDLKSDDIVVIDGKTYTFIEAKEINDDNGEFLGLELTLEDFNGNDVIPKTLFQYEDVLDIASELSDRTVKQSGTAKSKKTSEPKEVPAPQDAKPGSSGKLDSRVKYTVLESGRAVHFSYGVDKTNHAARNAKVKKAIDELSKTLGRVLFYYYDGSGKVFTNKEGDKRDFSDPDFNKAGYVLELLPGEKDSPNSILTKALKAIHAELAKPDQEEEVVTEGEAFSGSRSSNGQIAEGVSYAIDDSGMMTLSGNIPGGAEELSDYLNDAFPNGDVNFDPEGFPPTIYSFPSDAGKENELRSKILDEIKKFIESKTSKPSETAKPEPEAEEEEEKKPTEEEAAEPLQRSYDVLKAAQDFFMQQALSSPEARAYLEGRKISLETAKNLGIGFAPKDKSALYKHLASLGFTREEMMSVGLVAESDDQTPYDRFRSRILFPFKDSEGRVVGFNGRDITGKADAKYMLTAGPNPADPRNKSVFKKSEVVFNLDNAAEAAKKSGQLIIVEGPFDLLAYREAGFENVIAMSGSDIKQSQIDLIKNAVGEDVDIILSYDLDAAGQKATKLSHDLFTEAGYKTYTANDSSGDKDPADILLDGGPDALKSIVLNKKRVGGVTDDQLAEFTRLVSEYPDAFSPEELRQLAESIVDSSKETADTILNDLKERIEISPLRNELDALVNQAVKDGVILDLERSKIDYKISASQDKKQAIKDAIEKLKEKIQKATPPAKKTEISQGQRDSINRRLSMGVVTQEQRDAIVSILSNPELSKDDVSRVIQTLDLAEHIWRMDRGWAIDPEKGVVLSLKPVVDLGATPDEVYQRMKTYKPTKDVNGKDLPPEESPEQKFGRLVSTLLEQLTQGGPADRTLSEEDANALVRDIVKKLELNPNLKNDSAFLDKVLNRLANDANKNASTGGDWIPHLTKQNVESAFNDAIRDAGETLEEKPEAKPAEEQQEPEKQETEEEKPSAAPAVPRPSNLGTKTGTNALPQTGDNFNADGTPAYAPSTGPFRGTKFRAMVSEAYRLGGWKAVKDLIQRSNVVAFDTETTGIEEYDGQLKPGNRLVQLGASRVNKDGEVERFNIYINPETGVIMSDWSKDNLLRPELDENGNPTGNFIKIEKDWLDQQSDEKAALEQFIKFLGDDVVLLGHNLNFDISVLQEALDRHNLSINALGSMDTMDFAGYSLPTYNPTGKTKSGKDSRDGVVLDGPKRPDPSIKPEDLDPNNPLHFQPSKKLGDVLQYFGLEPAGWHRADADAEDSYRILENILDWLIANPGRESSNALGIKALEFEKINGVADKEIGRYLNAIGSGRPATSRQTSLTPVNAKGKPTPGFATDLRKMEVSEDQIKNIIAPMTGMTRGQAAEYIASILADLRAGNEPDTKKALQTAGFTPRTARPSNAIPDAANQEAGTVEHEVSKNAADLAIGDKVRRDGSDVYGTIKSIDRSTAGIIKITVAYDDGETLDISMKPSKKVAVYEEDNPKDATASEPQQESEVDTTSEAPDQNPTTAPAPEPTVVEPEEQGEAKPEGQQQAEPEEETVVIDISSYPAQDREGIREFIEIVDKLNSMEGKESNIKVVESGQQNGLVERTPKFIEAFASKEEIEKALTDLGISKLKARRIAKKLQNLEGKEKYFAELRKINEELAKEQRNKKSFGRVEKIMDFGDFLRMRGYPQGRELQLSGDPRDRAAWSKEYDLYWAWRDSLKKRGKTKTISDGNVSVTYSADEADEAQRLLDSTKKLQEEFPLDGRKLKVSVYSPEQLAILDIGNLVGASIVTDKLAHIAVSSSVVSRKELDPRENGSGEKDYSDLFTIIHEYGHVYDEIALNGNTRDKFVKQFKDSNITIYAEENMAERFAEHFMDLAYSKLKGQEPVSGEFKKFIEDGQESGDIDPTVLKKGGPFFGDEIVNPRRISAIVQGENIRGVGEKVESELQDFENATNTGNGILGAWLKGSDDEAGYIPDLSKDEVAKRYTDSVGVSKEEFSSLSEKDKAKVLEDVRKLLQPLVDAQRQDSRKYRVMTVDGTNVHVRFKEGSVDAKTLSDLVDELKALDNFSDMGGMPVIVTLADNNTFSIKGELVTDNDAGYNVSNSSGTQMHIVLNTKYKNEPSKPEPNDKYKGPAGTTTMLDTLVHEYLGHGLAKVFFGQRAKPSEVDHERFEEFKNAFPLPDDPKDHPVSEYGGTSHSESFAEYVRAAYALVRSGESPYNHPEILKFLQFIDERIGKYGPVRRTDKAGSDLALVDRRVVGETSRFPQPKKYYGELAAIDTYNNRDVYYSNNLDPYGRPVGSDFTETLEEAYSLVAKARDEYYADPSTTNFHRFAALASTINEIYDSRYFNYPKGNPRFTDQSILDNITTSSDASSMRRWQADKPFVPLRYPSTAEKFNNEMVVSTYTDPNGDVYQVAFISSKPAGREDAVSESAHVFVSKPNQPLSEFIDSGTTFNDLVKKSVGQMKIANFEKDNVLAKDELEIQGTYVDGKNRRKGLATAMLAIAKQNSPKYLRFSRQQTIQEDSWARAVDQNKENHLGLPAFTDPDGGLHPADRSPLISPAVGYRNTDPNVAEVPRINRTPNVGDRLEEEAFDAHSGRYLASSVFAGSRDYYSANGGGLGLDQSVVGAVRTDALSSMAGNEVDEARVLEIMEKIKSGEGFKDPVIVYYDPETGNMVVADGNHHVEAAKRLGIDLIPTRVITGKFDPSEYLSVKKSTKEWKAKPFKSKKWPTHVNPYFIFESKDLIGYEDDDVIIDKREIKKAIGKVEPDEISKLIGRYVIDNVTGQVYMVYDEHYDPETGEPTGKIIVERLVGTFDVTGDFAESRINGKLTFNSDGKLLMIKGGPSLNGEYNDIRQYELEIKDLSDFSDVTESFVKSGGMPLVVTESMFYVWSGRDIKGRINRFLSPGKVELAELIGVDENGENQYKLHEVPVSELGLIQRERESLSETPVDHSEDMLAGNVLYGQVISVAKSLLADGFLDRSFFAAILETVKGRFQTRSGVEDMLESLRRLNKRRIKQKREEVLKKKLETATTKRAVIKEPEAEAPAEAPKQEVVKGRMTFKQLYDQAVEDRKNGVKRDPFTDTKSPATEESSNPLSKPDIDALSEIAIILAELTDVEGPHGLTKEQAQVIMESLKTASKEGADADLQKLRARVLAKRLSSGQPIGDLILPDGIDKDSMRGYTPEFNMDGTDYTGPEGTTFSDDEIYGEKEEIIDYIKYVLSPGDFLAITGGAGTGKTTIIRQLIKNSRNTNLAVVSPTGTAARNVGPGAATTIHSLFGFDKNVILSGEFDVEIEDEDENGNPIVVRYTNEQQFVSKYAGTKKGKALAKLDLLVIDEVSMVNSNLMDAMDLALRVAKGKMDLPFGGTKVVAFGDDNQLPPVEFWNPDSSRTRKLNDDLAAKKITKEEYDAEMRVELDKKAKHEYMLLDYDSYRWFDSKVFAQQKPLHHRLEKIYRQKDDLAFAELLKRLANTKEITQKDIDFINSRYGYRPEDPNALRIVLTNKRADAINKQAIEKLQQEGAASQEFVGTFKGIRRAFKDDDLHAPEKITYYIGEKVVFTVNDGKDLRDQVGFRGTTRWSNGTQGTVVGFDEERGLPIVEIMVESADGKKEPVQVVVGRATSAASGASSDTVYDEISGSPQERFSTKTEAEYTQIPLMPAYAITVHKSQGMTISGEAIIDFLDEDGKPADVFAAGQAYVALSRFTDLKNVFLTRKITAADFISDNRVEEYYAGVEDIEIGDAVQKAKKEKQDKAASEDSEPTVDRRQISGETTLFKTISKADLKTAKSILSHKTKSIRNLPSDWGTSNLSDNFSSLFGYDDEQSFKQDLNAIASKKIKDLTLEQQLLASLIIEHGEADIYTHAESGTTIKRRISKSRKESVSDEDVLMTVNAHKMILDSGHIINGGMMKIEMSDSHPESSDASGRYSPSSDVIDLFTGSISKTLREIKELSKKPERMNFRVAYLSKISKQVYLATVLAHEYGHYLDSEVENFNEDRPEDEPSVSAYILDLIKAGMKNRAREVYNKYALANKAEYLAESYAGFVLKDMIRQVMQEAGVPVTDESLFDSDLIAKLLDAIDRKNFRSPGQKPTPEDLKRRQEAMDAQQQYDAEIETDLDR